MAYINWSNKLETGINTIDNQHKKLVQLVNDLYEAMHQGHGKLIVGEILSKLVQYTVYHFATEEKAFKKYAYPGRFEHEQEHQALIKTIEELEKKYKTEPLVVSLKTLQFLYDWVTNHIQKEDMEYVPFLKDKAIE